jgi:hypothetical protein
MSRAISEIAAIRALTNNDSAVTEAIEIFWNSDKLSENPCSPSLPPLK